MKVLEPLKNFFLDDCLEAGCDEAGRGCLAGPVFAAAVILPKDFYHKDLMDSKLLSEKKRNELRVVIENNAITHAVAYCSPQEIDEMNILWASVCAMHKAISQLKFAPQHIIVDGNRFKPYNDIPHQCIIKGDQKYASIAAASILAKTYRDELMQNLSIEFPNYLWNKNKGYPTREHSNAIIDFGTSVWHRKSFNLYTQQLNIFDD